MGSAICTLFEGHYHFGVAALTNSLYRQGYLGSIYAGYRGTLPNWASGAKEDPSLLWPGSQTLKITEEFKIHFLPLHTKYHFANYKPDFMLELWDGPAKGVNEFFYFDPDIIVIIPWSFIKEWVSYGVVLCEDVYSPLFQNHPRRMAWRRYFGEKGIPLRFKEPIYANSGFVGVSKENRSFLVMWRTIQEAIAPLIGGLDHAPLTGTGYLLPHDERRSYNPFGKTDQDAMNAAIEAWEGEVSFIGQEGMALKPGASPGASLMPHALGKPKPWKWKPLTQALAGRPPRLVDREYWKFSNGPIISQSVSIVQSRKIAIKVAAFIGRFYKRT
jgi:hypothetical protein